MADSSSEHLIRIIVEAINRAKGIGEQVSKEVEKATGAQEKHTKSVKDNDKAIEELRKEHKLLIDEIKSGNKSYDDARFALARISSEFDKLARRQKIGSGIAEDLNRGSLAAKRLAEQLKVAHETESKLEAQAARDRIRREEERQRLTQQTIEREVKQEEAGVKARRSLMNELMDVVRQDHEDRIAFNRELTRLEVEEERRRTKARVDESVRSAQAIADVSRRQDVQRAPQTIRQRISSFFGREDTGPKRFIQDLTGVTRATGDAERGVSRMDRALQRLHGTTDRTSFSVARVDNNLRGLVVIGVVAFAQQIISSLVSLASTLFAVGAAAVQAGAALGGAFVAAAAQAVPAIGVLVAAFGRIGAVFKAVHLFNQQATRSGRDQTAAAEAQAAAADRVASAQEGVASASQSVLDATEALTKAREQAIRNIQDLNLAERSASLSRFESQKALRQAISTGDVGSLEGLRIQADTATLGARRATTDAGRARAQGVEGSDQVRQAVRTLDDANTALGRARREMSAANRAAAQAVEQTSSADQALKEALAQLTPAERALFESLKRIQERYRQLFRPITDIIVRAFTDAVDRVRVVMGDPRILGPLRGIAEAIATSIRRITRELTSDRFIKFFQVMATEAGKNIPLLTTIAIKVARIMSVVAQAASPALRKFIEFLDEIVTKGDKATDSRSGLSRLQKFFLRGEEMAESFARLTGAVIGLFAALAGAGAADTGQSAIDQLTDQINKATDWINDNQDKVRQFFSDSLDAAKAISRAIFEIGRFVATAFDSEKVQDFARAFNEVLLPAITTVVLALGGLTGLLIKLLDIPLVGEFAQFALATGFLFKAFNVIFKLLGPFAEKLVLLLGKLPLVGRAIRAFGIAVRFAATVMSGPWGLAIAAAITAIVLLDQKFHFIRPTIRFLANLLKDVLAGAFTFVKTAAVAAFDAVLGAFSQIAGAISSLASAASKLPFVGDKFKGVAEVIDAGRDKIDKYRESLRETNKEHDKTPSKAEKIQTEVGKLARRLGTLKKGTDEYRETAIKLRHRQEDLNVAMVEAEQKGKRGARGPRAIGRSATSAAEAVDKANKAITKGYNQLAEQLGGIKKITYSASGVTVHGGTSDITADTGDITAGRAMGGWIGRSWGPQGPDEHVVLAGSGEAFLNRPQQGPVEEGLALRSMLMGGPGNLSELFRQFGGAAFATGGFVDKVRERANRLAAMHLPYRWGGGHGVGTISDKEAAAGLDCSGAVGYALGIPARHSSAYASLGRGGDRGQVVVYSNAEHTFMRILGRFFGTSGFGHPQAGPGAAWFTVPPSTSYLKKFVARSMGANDVGDGSGATGIGDISAPRITGPAGALRRLAQRAVSRTARAANRRLGEAGDAAGQGLSDAGALVNPVQIRNWIRAGLRLAGQKVTAGAVQTLLGRIMQESSGNPNAVNRWDINARRGDPSRGILQTTSSTFNRYKVRGHDNITNPVDNIAAAIRYMLARYGHLVGRSSTGYQTGGFVAGRRPTGRSYTAPTIFNTSFQGVLAELGRAVEAVAAIKTRGSRFIKRFSRSFDQIFGENGLLDQGSAAIQRTVDVMALRLRQATFQVTRSGVVVRRLTPAQQNLALIPSLDQQREGFQSLRGVAASSLRDVERRLGVIRRGGVTSKERKAYETLVAAQRKLVERILGIDQAIADAVEARFNAQEQAIQDVIDNIDQTAQKTLTRADLADRVANVIQNLPGLDQTSFALRGAALQARSSALIGQRDQLTQFAGIAGAMGRQDIVTQLVAKIEELNVQLFENAAAIRANTVAARQAQIDAITNRGSFLGGVSSGLSGILQTIGTTTGTLDVGRLRAIGEQAGSTLRGTGDALRQQLAEAFGVDLRGLSSTGLVDALRGLNFDQIEVGLSVDQRQQFEGLINAIIDNAGAIESNTQQLQELNASQQVQSFTTTAWQLFRRAIFNGMGGLLPQYRMPLMQSGGTILSDGLLYGHRDEMIVPAQVSRDANWSQGDTNNIYITNPTETADPGYIAEVLSFRRSLSRATR